MLRYHIEPTELDRDVASQLARHISPDVEGPAKVLTLAADERVLLAGAAVLWLASRAGSRRQRAQADYIAANVAVTAVLPHLFKHVFAQLRPDRVVVHGRRRGIPRSGNAWDAFPSGHAIHIGAVASALSRFFPHKRGLIWSVGTALAATRVLLLAHWVSDVVAGLTLGVAIERTAWRLRRRRRRRGRPVDVRR